MTGKTRLDLTIDSHLKEAYKATVNNMSRDIEEYIRQRVDMTNRSIEELEEEIAALQQQNQHDEREIEDRKQEIEKREEKIDVYRQKIAELEKQEAEDVDDSAFWDDMVDAVFHRGFDSQEAFKKRQKNYNNKFHAELSFSDFLERFEVAAEERGFDPGEVMPQN